MQKFDNFVACFDVLKSSNRDMAKSDEIYRTGVIGQFSLAFELSWKTLQEVMRAHAINEAENGSPREILKAGFKYIEFTTATSTLSNTSPKRCSSKLKN